jgi:hypothetical protein
VLIKNFQIAKIVSTIFRMQSILFHKITKIYGDYTLIIF